MNPVKSCACVVDCKNETENSLEFAESRPIPKESVDRVSGILGLEFDNKVT